MNRIGSFKQFVFKDAVHKTTQGLFYVVTQLRFHAVPDNVESQINIWYIFTQLYSFSDFYIITHRNFLCRPTYFSIYIKQD